jgi:hypothetical protein
MVLKLDTPPPSNVSCNVGIAHYALGDDAEGRQVLNTCHQKVPNPPCMGTTKPKCGGCSLHGSREEMAVRSTIQTRADAA